MSKNRPLRTIQQDITGLSVYVGLSLSLTLTLFSLYPMGTHCIRSIQKHRLPVAPDLPETVTPTGK